LGVTGAVPPPVAAPPSHIVQMMAPQNDRVPPVAFDGGGNDNPDGGVPINDPLPRPAREAGPPPPHPLRTNAVNPEIPRKLRDLGIDLAKHIVLASITMPPSVDVVDGAANFPPRLSGSILNLLTTDDETRIMRRLVTKALMDKSPSFTSLVNSLPRIPSDIQEFRDIFSTVVDNMIMVHGPQQLNQRQQQHEQQNDFEYNISWGKLVTAFAFGLRLTKAVVDRRQAAGLQQQQQPLLLFSEEDATEWGGTMGDILAERMGTWIESQGGWKDGFNDYFLDGRGLEEDVTKKLIYFFVFGVGAAILYKLFKS